MGSGSGAGGISSRFVGGISTSTGSSLGQILPGSSLGQASFEGGQLEGCMEESEPIGDHKRSGEGLVPKRGKRNCFLCFAINFSTYLHQYKGVNNHHWMDMEEETLVCQDPLQNPHHREYVILHLKELSGKKINK